MATYNPSTIYTNERLYNCCDCHPPDYSSYKALSIGFNQFDTNHENVTKAYTFEETDFVTVYGRLPSGHYEAITDIQTPELVNGILAYLLNESKLPLI